MSITNVIDQQAANWAAQSTGKWRGIDKHIKVLEIPFFQSCNRIQGLDHKYLSTLLDRSIVSILAVDTPWDSPMRLFWARDAVFTALQRTSLEKVSADIGCIMKHFKCQIKDQFCEYNCMILVTFIKKITDTKPHYLHHSHSPETY